MTATLCEGQIGVRAVTNGTVDYSTRGACGARLPVQQTGVCCTVLPGKPCGRRLVWPRVDPGFDRLIARLAYHRMPLVYLDVVCPLGIRDPEEARPQPPAAGADNRPVDIGDTRGVSGARALAATQLPPTDPTALAVAAGQMQTPLPRVAIGTLHTGIRVVEVIASGAVWATPERGREIVIVSASHHGHGVLSMQPVCHEQRNEFVSGHSVSFRLRPYGNHRGGQKKRRRFAVSPTVHVREQAWRAT
jgi:hypothetical protein